MAWKGELSPDDNTAVSNYQRRPSLLDFFCFLTLVLSRIYVEAVEHDIEVNIRMCSTLRPSC